MQDELKILHSWTLPDGMRGMRVNFLASNPVLENEGDEKAFAPKKIQKRDWGGFSSVTKEKEKLREGKAKSSGNKIVSSSFFSFLAL